MTWPWQSLHRHLDLLIALALTALGQAELWFGLVQGGPPVPTAVAVAVGTLAVAERRRRPVLTVVVSCMAMTVQAALGVDANSAFAPLLAAFLAIGTAGYLATRPVRALACALGLVGCAVVIVNGQPRDGDETLALASDLLYAALLVTLAWLVGRGFAVGRLQRELSHERAAAAAAQERLRIARDVHDIVAHSLSVMALHAGGARRLLHHDQTQAIEALEVVEETGRQALAEIREVLADVRAPTDPTLSRASLDRAVEPLRAAGLSVRLTVADLPDTLPDPVGVAGHRVVQEAVTNVLRHAGASAVGVTAAATHDRLRIEIVDDGTGPTRSTPGGYGLRGMQERVGEAGGTLETGRNVSGRGFRVAADLPLVQAP